MQYWQKNISSIEKRWSSLAKRLARLTPQTLIVEESKNHLLVPIIDNKPLHSLYDPVKEASKLLHIVSEGYLCIGLGAGYTAKEALETKQSTMVIVIEPQTQSLANLIAHFDYQDLLEHPNFFLLTNNNCIPHLFNDIALLYQPLLHGNLTLIIPRIIDDLYPNFCTSFTNHWQEWLSSLSRELSTWHYFGRRWFKNIVTNLTTINIDDKIPLKPVKLALIAGAGPSLEQAIPKFRQAQTKGALLICSDAAALTLQAYNITADIILSIDAQMIVQYHFLGLKDQYHYIISDLSVHPRRNKESKQFFFAGSHPLARMSGLRHLATDAGNVGTVAYHLAKVLGAKNVLHAGLDFAYLHKKPYAYPNYLYSQYQANASRMTPTSQAIAELTFRSLPINYDATTQTYQSDLLSFYKQKFVHLSQQTIKHEPLWGESSINGKAFLQQYLQQLEAMNNKENYSWDKLSPQAKQILYTLFPSMTSGYQQGLRNQDLWNDTLDFAINQIKNTEICYK